jgi:hypothetical protein
MNLRRLKKEFGRGVEVEVSRDRKSRTVTAVAAGLSYRAEERAFGSEREMAEHLKSKLPAIRIRA